VPCVATTLSRPWPGSAIGYLGERDLTEFGIEDPIHSREPLHQNRPDRILLQSGASRSHVDRSRAPSGEGPSQAVADPRPLVAGRVGRSSEPGKGSS
jgi:hypothetical protein